MSAIQRFQAELDGLQGPYDLLSEKIARLRQALAIETDVTHRFEQEKLLERAEAEQAELLTKIEALEAKMEARQSEQAETRGPVSPETQGFSSNPAHWPPRRALPADLLNRLKSALLKCGPFASSQALCAVFVDQRINPWLNVLHDAGSPAERVNQLIKDLYDRYNDARENALLLFVRVLRDETDPQDLCHRRLGELASDLEQATREFANEAASEDGAANQVASRVSAEEAEFIAQPQASPKGCPLTETAPQPPSEKTTPQPGQEKKNVPVSPPYLDLDEGTFKEINQPAFFRERKPLDNKGGMKDIVPLLPDERKDFETFGNDGRSRRVRVKIDVSEEITIWSWYDIDPVTTKVSCHHAHWPSCGHYWDLEYLDLNQEFLLNNRKRMRFDRNVIKVAWRIQHENHSGAKRTFLILLGEGTGR